MKTPLTEALKTMREPEKKEKPTIRICGCGTPLIWTFAFAYNERYCLNCGTPTPMFDGNDDVEATRELKFKKELVDAIWKVIYTKKGLLPSGTYTRRNCKKCNEDQNHNNHLAKAEKELDKIAREYLEKFKGFFNNE